MCSVRWLVLLSFAASACAPTQIDDPILIGVTPDRARNDRATTITIAGERFYLEVITDLISPKGVRSNADFSAALGGTPLQEVQWLSNTELTAVIPEGLVEGRHRLIVTGPTGHTASLDDAVRITVPQPSAVEWIESTTSSMSTSELGIDTDLASSVDPSRSILFFNFTHASVNPADGMVTGQLINNGQTVHFERLSAGMVGVQIQWTVLQLSDISVQRGNSAYPAALSTAALTTSVDATRSFVLASLRTDGVNYNWNDWLRASLADSTTVQFAGGWDSASVNAVIEWQVVELLPTFAGDLQIGTTQLADAATFVSVNLPQRVRRDRSLMFFSYGTGVSNNTLANNAIRGRIVSDQALEFDRDGTANPYDITWYLLEWDAMRARHDEIHFDVGIDSLNVSVACPGRFSAALALLPGFLRQGKTPHASDGVGESWFTTELIDDGCTLVLTRGSSLDPADAAWSVVWFD